MMPAAKFMDPVMGIDIHLIQPPGPVPPLPIPHPFVGMLYDPMELAPIIGATVFVNGMPKATAGSEGKAVPPHIPIGGVFVPPPPGNECEMFMGSATVLFEGEPASYTALPALSCQSIGVPAPPRAKKKPKPIMKLPLSVVVPIPAGPPVLIGGPPTISLTVIGMKILMSAAGKAAKKLRKAMKKSKKIKAISKKIHKAAKKAMDKLGIPPSVQNKVHKGICTVTGHPVDVATGKVFTDNEDFSLPGPIPISWERTWFSTSVYEGPLGQGWHHSYDLALVEDDKAVAVRMPDGRGAAFPRLEPGNEFFDRMEKLTLVRDDQGYAVRTLDRLLHRFAAKASPRGECPLVSISDPAGNAVRFQYDSLGRLDNIQDSAGRLIQLLNDWKGRILQIMVPHPELADKTFAVMKYRYDDYGDMVEALDALGQPWQFQYRNHLLVKETNRNGLTFQFEYDRADSTARCLRTWGDGGIYDHKLSYHADSKTTTVVDSLGFKTVYHGDDSGLVTQVDNALGHSSQTLHNDFNELEKEIDELGQETVFEYDIRGNCIKVTNPDGSVVETLYVDDKAVSAKDPMGGEWKWEYDDRSRPVKNIDPMGRESHYRYQDRNLAAYIDPAGGETLFSWNAASELALLVARDQTEGRWEYDRLGRCVEAIDPKGNVQKRAFDALGRLRKVEEPDGNVRELEYDPEGNVVRAKDQHRSITLKYTGMNRLASRAEHGRVVEFLYDREECLVGVRNEKGLAFGFELDAMGEITAEISFDGVRQLFHRDPKGRVSAVERPGGILTQYEYDAGDRLLKATHSTGETESFAYRPDGELIEASNDSIKVAFELDILGKTVKEDQGGFWVSSTYDVLDNRIEMQSSLGARQLIERNAMGEHTRVSYGADDKAPAWEAKITRDKSGIEIERTLPGGLKSIWVRDKTGRPLRHNIASPKEFRSREYIWDVNDRLKSLRDPRYGLRTFEHDPHGNLVWCQESDGLYIFRVPDAVGNLYRSAERDDRKYGPAGQLLEARGAKGVTRYEYDPQGNLSRKTEPGSRVWNYHWNAAGMLAKVVRPDGLEVSFAYDAIGRRISKTFRGRTTRWVWDADNPLHEWVEGKAAELPGDALPGNGPGNLAAAANRREAELAGNPPAGPPPEESGTPEAPITWLFDPDGPFPMGKIAGTKKYSIITDHLGSPLAMFDGAGQETWSAQIDVYGQLTRLVGDREACPFRFPGQYEDAETGLHYNRFRFYDPEAGAYISQDPIRLSGGNHLYTYAHDPSVWSDPFGLFEGVNFAGTDAMHPAGGPGQLNETPIKMQGSRGRDFTEANKKAGFKKTPKGYTWHHVDDFDPKTGTCTMQLVKKKSHVASYPHGGSVSQFEKKYKVKYGKKDALDVAEKKGWMTNPRPKKKKRKKKGHCK